MAATSTTVPPDNNTRLTLDQDNPFYLHSSDNPGMKLISDSFDGTGFSNQKRSMTIALSARNKLGFVDGSIIKPASNDSTFKSWSRCNDMHYKKTKFDRLNLTAGTALNFRVLICHRSGNQMNSIIRVFITYFVLVIDFSCIWVFGFY